MNKTIIHNWNQRVHKDDVVYHIGDFCFKGGWEGGTNKAIYWESQLNGKIIHIRGNHDLNNGVKAIMTNVLAEFGDKVILMQHRPPTHPAEILPDVDMVLCGHVHEQWKLRWVNNVPVINVGVDQWNFNPIRLTEILVYYDSLMKKADKKSLENSQPIQTH